MTQSELRCNRLLFLGQQTEHAHLDTPALWRIRRRLGVVEGSVKRGMKRVLCAVEGFEEQPLLWNHLRKVIPLVPRVGFTVKAPEPSFWIAPAENRLKRGSRYRAPVRNR